jgi:hypothetical protein
MAKKARLQGSAGNYRIRGAIWELGSFAYRAYVHVIPTVPRSNLSRRALSADGMTLQEVLGAAKARVNSTIGTPRGAARTSPHDSTDAGAFNAATTARSSTLSSSDGLRNPEVQVAKGEDAESAAKSDARPCGYG